MWKKIADKIEQHELWWWTSIGVAFLRIPNFFEPYWYGDEGIYLALGNSLRAGLRLYADIIDHKTPIIYWMAQWAGSLVWFKFILFVASLASIGLFYLILRRTCKGLWAMSVGLILFALLTTLPWFEGHIANGELLLMPMILGGVYLFWKYFPRTLKNNKNLLRFDKVTPWWQPFLVGSLFSLALLLKVPAGFDFAALGIFYAFFVPYMWKKNRIVNFVKYGLFLVFGFLLPILVSIVYFAARNSLSAYFDFGLLYNFRYIQAWGTPFKNPVAIFLAGMKGRVLLLGLGLLLLWFVRNKLSLVARFAWVWFLLALFAALLSLRPYPHYFIQAIPPLCLLIAIMVSEKWWVKLRLGLVFLVLSVVMLGFLLKFLNFYPYPTVSYYKNFVLYLTGKIDKHEYYNRFDSKTARTYKLASFLKERTKKYERVFIWGDEPMVYALSERVPSGRFTVAFHIVSFKAFEETIKAIREQKPRYILWFTQDGYEFNELKALVDEEYIPMGKVEGVDIYRRW